MLNFILDFLEYMFMKGIVSLTIMFWADFAFSILKILVCVCVYVGMYI